MAGVPRLDALVAVVGVTMLLAILYGVGRHATPRDPAGDPGAGGSEGAAGGQVRCPHCGVENDAAYRFCRRCVADLDRPVAPGRPGDQSSEP